MNARTRAIYARRAELARAVGLPSRIARAYVDGERLAVVFVEGGRKSTILERWSLTTVEDAVLRMST